MTDIEWKIRIELVARYRLAALYGMTDLIATQICARLPAPLCDDDHSP